MFSVYKGLLLFILIANTIAIPIFKRESTDGKNYVFETVKTLLNCVCYYEEGTTLDNGKIEKYCDCTPEKVEQDQSIVPEDEIENKVNAAKLSKNIDENDSHEIESKFSSAKYMKTVNGDDENLDDVQKYGSADAAFFADIDKNEARQEQENIYDEIQSQIDNQIKKVENAKYLTGEGFNVFDGDEENLSNVQKYGSADSAFFANMEENEAKQEQENINDDMAIPLFNGDGQFIPQVDDGEDVDVAAMEGDVVEDIPEYNNIDGTSNAADNIVNTVNNDDTVNDFKYSFASGVDIGISDYTDDNDDEVVNDESAFYDNNNGDFEMEFTGTRAVYDRLEKAQQQKKAANNDVDVIYDEDGNEIDLEIEMVGEAYHEVANDDDDDDEDDKGILDSLDVGANAKYVIDYYNNENDVDDEEVYEDMELDLEDEGNLGINKNVQQKAMKNTDIEDDDDDDDSDDDGINDGDDLKSIYKKLIVNKLKEDIKKMDSEKLIVDILKEALQGGGKDSTISNILN